MQVSVLRARRRWCGRKHAQRSCHRQSQVTHSKRYRSFDRPRPSYPPKTKIVRAPIKFAECPLSPGGTCPFCSGCDQVMVDVSRTNRSLRCFVPECPPKRKSLLPTAVTVWALRDSGGVPVVRGCSHVIVSMLRSAKRRGCWLCRARASWRPLTPARQALKSTVYHHTPRRGKPFVLHGDPPAACMCGRPSQKVPPQTLWALPTPWCPHPSSAGLRATFPHRAPRE